jgi:sortase A
MPHFLKKRFLTFPVSTLLRGLGLVLLAYVAVQYFAMWASQQRLAREWAQERKVGTADPRAGLTRLVIPKIDLDAIVVEGASDSALLAGPGHLEDTPKAGESGNTIIAGHRDTFFRRVHELRPGDKLILRRMGREFQYRVVSSAVVDPDNADVLADTRTARVTLITCFPQHYIGPAPKRLIVKADLIS